MEKTKGGIEMKVVPIEKQSKKNQKEYYKRQRQTNGFNTGTRDMGKIKDEEFAKILDKELDNYNY